MNIRANELLPVVTIEKGRGSLPEPEQYDSFTRDMSQSYTKNKILCDKVCGVEKINGDFCMVVFHGPYKIRIPFEKSGIVLPDSADGSYSRKELTRRILEGRLGSEVEYKVYDFLIGETVSYGDREFAMMQRTNEYFFKSRTDGSFLLDKDVIVEARVLHCAPRSLTVEVFGKEVVIGAGKLKPWPVYDSRKYFRNGETTLVRITDISREDGNIKIDVSAKDAIDFDIGEIVSSYEKNAIYTGIVIWVSNNKYMVCLNDNIGCLCSKSSQDYPAPGQEVVVKVIGVNKSENKIWGTIIDVAG